MCGIVGIYSFKNSVQHQKNYIQWCMQTMKHRGPDSNGIWSNEKNYITGFVRLAIQDVTNHANQPMQSSCKRYCITYNGEIYNAENYRKTLQQKGVEFQSTGDTEILLYAIIYFGIEKVLNEFDGMFAFAFYDLLKDELIIARDRIGIKPLYIGFNSNTEIIYSSQYNHIINYDKIANETLNFSAIGNYLQLGYNAAGAGIVNNTQLLSHGHYAVINSKGCNIHQYYSVQHKTKNLVNLSFENIINQSVQSQLISDVPVGTFLSGGVDSSLITIVANQQKKNYGIYCRNKR